MNYPRVLVVSNNSFSKTNSNGKTLSSFFVGWPKERLSQFCISTDVPNYDICNNYYLITDHSALDGFLHFCKANRSPIENNYHSKDNLTVFKTRKVYKTPRRAVERHIIWSFRRWKSDDFIKWVDGFNPEVLFVMNSDSAFMLKIACDISKSKNIPILQYNTEGFYFFKKPYMSLGKNPKFWFGIYQAIYRKCYKTFMKAVNYTIYCNEKLQEDYVSEFGGANEVIYTGSSMTFNPGLFNSDSPTFSYIGNLGYSRIDALIEVADVLQDINNSYYLDIYGRAPDYVVEKAQKCRGIRLKGFIGPSEVMNVIQNSDILFHAESQSDSLEEALRYGFSTKIADSVASGKIFIMYSSLEIAGAKYLQNNHAGYVVSTKNSLKKTIEKVLFSPSEREIIHQNAKSVAYQNHNIEINRQKLLDAINNIILPL